MKQLVPESGATGNNQVILWLPLLVGAGTLNVLLALFPRTPALLVLGAAVGVAAITYGAVRLASRTTGQPRIRPAGSSTLRVGCWSGVVVVYSVLLFRILTNMETGADLALWAFGIGLVTVPLIGLRQPSFRLPRRGAIADWMIAGSLMALTAVLHAHDLRDWYYTAIGDDIGFYLRILDIIDHGIIDPFTLKGMYHNSPMLNSLYQAGFSWLFGGGSAWGWKFSAVFSVMLTVPPIYMLGRRFAGRTAGLVASVMLLSSHYVMAFTHTGYTHLDALPVTAWAVWALVEGTRRRNAGFLLAAGMLSGLALYTALPARVVYPLFGLWILMSIRVPRDLPALWPLPLGFAAVALPFLAENQIETALVMGRDTMSPNSIFHSEMGDPVQRLIGNIERNLPLWWVNELGMSHYTSGSLLDRVSGTLALVGIGMAVVRWSKRHRLLLFWLAITLIPTALLAPYPQPPLTRLHSPLLPLSLMSGIAVSALLGMLPVARILKVSAVGTMLAAIVALNVWRFQVVTPEALHHYQPEALAVKAWQTECDARIDTLFIGEHGHLMDISLLTYLPRGDRPRLIENYDDQSIWDSDGVCRIFFRPNDHGAQGMIGELTDNPAIYENPSGATWVVLVSPTG